MFLILTQFSTAVLAGMGLDISSKWIINNRTADSLKKLGSVMGSMLIIIFGLTLMMKGDPDYGVRSNPMLNALRDDMLNSDMIKSILFILIGGLAFYIVQIDF